MSPAAAAATPVYVLGNDLLHEVFLRLPNPADLLRTALACKFFLGAVRNAAFLRQFRRLHPSTCPLLLGCLLHPEDHRRNGSLLLLPVEPADAPRRVVERGDFALSFLPGGAPCQVLDCRNGRLLARKWGSGELVVADPLSRRWVSLPAPPTELPVGYGLVAGDGNSSVFRAVCISRDAGSSEMRALVLSSSELRWADVAALASQPNLAGSRAMQAHRSLYWKLEGGERMVALNTATTEFSLVDLPKEMHELSFDVIEKGEDGAGGLYLLTMRGWSIEVWAGVEDGTGGLTWRLVETSVRFNRAMEEMHGSPLSYRDELDVIGVVAGVVFLRHGALLFSIDLETMKPERLSLKEDCPPALIYPYTTVWPPLFLSPTEQGAS